MRKFLGLIIAVVMVFMQAVPAFAIMDKGELAVGDTVWFAGAAGATLVKWKVVVDNGNDLILISDTDINSVLTVKQPWNRVESNVWSSSSLRAFLNGNGIGEFMTFFTKAEKRALLDVDGSDKVSIPTMAQVLDGGTWHMTEADRIKGSYEWWLRDNAGGTKGARAIKHTGAIDPGGYLVTSTSVGIIPYINVKLDDVLFAMLTTESTGEVSENLTKVEKKPGALKLVMKDTTNQKILGATQSNKPMSDLSAGDTISINYKGASIYNNMTGSSDGNVLEGFADRAISCIITDDTGSMVYYGVLGTFTNGHMYGDTPTASGTVSLKLPADYDASKHSIMLYAEAVHRGGARSVTNYISDGVPLEYVPGVPPIIPPTRYTLTINGGGIGNSGSGTYEENDVVPIYAGTIDGHTFSHWSQTTTGGISATIADPSLDRTTATMPAGNVVLVANWTPPLTQYTLTVENGGVGSSGSGSYSENDIVPIYAGTKENYVFDGWTVTTSIAGITVDVGDLTAENTNVKMPADNVVMKANWKTAPITPPIDPPVNPPDNDNDGDYEEPIITTTTEPEKIPPMPQEPLAVEPPNTETGDNSPIALVTGILFACGIICGVIGGMTYKKHKEDKDK